MFPELINLGPITVHTYGVMIALAFLAGLYWSVREADRLGLNTELVPDLGFRVLFGAILGARTLYVILNWPYFLEHPLEVFAFWQGGLVFSGGLILASLLGWLKMRREPNKLLWMDAIAPGLALGQGIGRIGCLAAGCCYGAQTHVPWAIVFTDPTCLAPIGTPVHPTQIYHSIAGFLSFGLLTLMRKKFHTPGRIAGLYLLLFAGFRFTIEFFRSDYRGEFGPMSATQAIALAFMALGLFFLTRKQARSA